jgi:hypothetical protein
MMLSNKESNIMPLINRVHKYNGLFHGSESHNGGLWMNFIFSSQFAVDRFINRLQIENLGGLIKLGDMPLSIKVMI